MTHTKGPWESTGVIVHTQKKGEYLEAYKFIATTVTLVTADDLYPQAEANARLIAAAPTMLKALYKGRDACQWMAGATDADPEDHERLAVVEAAIREAKGK